MAEIKVKKAAVDGLSQSSSQPVEINVTVDDWINEKTLREIAGRLSKWDNKADRGASISDKTGTFSSGAAAQELIKSDLTKMAVDAAAKSVKLMAANFGDEFGTMMGSTFSGALNGAIAGAAISGPMAPAGAAIGTLIGLIDGAAQVVENQQEYFSGLVKSQYSELLQLRADSLTKGSAIAAQKEKDVSLKTLSDMGIDPDQMSPALMDNYMAATTYIGKLNKLEQMQQEIDAAAGAAYNEERSKGIDQQIAYLEKYGSAIKEMKTGALVQQARIENEREKMIRESEEGVLESYKAEGGSPEDAYRRFEAARVQGEANFRGSKYFENWEDREKTLISSMRKALANSWGHFGYDLAQEFSKGIPSGDLSDPENAEEQNRRFQVQGSPFTVRDGEVVPDKLSPTRAWLDYYRKQNEGQQPPDGGQAASVQVTVTGNSFVLRPEEDVESLFERFSADLAKKLRQVQAIS